MTLFPIKKRFTSRKTLTLSSTTDLTAELTLIDYERNRIPLAHYNLTNISNITND